MQTTFRSPSIHLLGPVLVSVLPLLPSVVPIRAEVPLNMSYQGMVTDSGEDPVADGSYPMRFRIYDAFVVGTLLWDSGTQTINVTDGVFNVYLGKARNRRSIFRSMVTIGLRSPSMV